MPEAIGSDQHGRHTLRLHINAVSLGVPENLEVYVEVLQEAQLIVKKQGKTSY
jgi:hypothetical protein